MIATPARYYSLDVFRGVTVALMILVNNPGTWAHIYSPLEHAVWHGCTPTDLVFPFFLFAVGNALSFVMPKFENAGTSVFLKKVLKRTALIILIGLFLNWSPFITWQNNHFVGKPWENVRIMGVLQRIALCYFFGALLIYFLKPKGAFVAGGIILLVYWFLCFWLGSPADPYSLPGYFGTHIDIDLFGLSHVYKGEGLPFDPEGLGSTAPAIVQVIFGFLVGQYIQQKGKNYEMLTNLFVAAMVLIFAGFCLDKIFPINKKIWSSSYVLYSTGLAMAVLSVIIYIIEFKGERSWWMRFFDVFGKNALFIFFISGFLPRLLGLIRIFSKNDAVTGKPVYTSPFGWFYEHICKPISPDLKVGSLFYALCMLVSFWLIVSILDRKKIYIKV